MGRQSNGISLFLLIFATFIHEMNDPTIRASLVKKYISSFPSETIWLHEVGILNGKCIVDLMAVTPNSIEGFEIKSGSDNLSRLPKQIESYNRIFDFITLVTERIHLEDSMSLIPSFWGIILAEADLKSISFKQIRSPEINKKNVSSDIARLIWKPEAVLALNELGFKNVGIQRVSELRRALLKQPDNIRTFLYSAIKKRASWKSQINT